MDSHELIQLLPFVLDRKKRERGQQIMSYKWDVPKLLYEIW